MKRILNIIGIFFLSIIVFTGCQNFTGGRNGNVPANKGTIKFRYALLLV